MSLGEELPTEVVEEIRRIARQEAKNEDTVLSDQLSSFESSVHRWMSQVQDWQAQSMEDRRLMRDGIKALQDQQTELIDFLFGKEVRDPAGRVTREGGALANGRGVKVEIPWGKLTGVIAAAITTTGGIVAAIISAL